MSNEIAQRIIARYNSLEADASNFRTAWQDCADYILPRRGQIMTQRAPGEKQTTQLFDSTAVEAAQIMAAGLLSQLTPPGELWARLEPAAKDPSPAVASWYDGESQGLMEDIHNSNFYLAAHETFLNLAAFCTGDIYLQQGKKRFFLNFCSVAVGTFVIAEDNEGVVDTVYKKWKWTARQAEQEWGREALGPIVTKALVSTEPSEMNKKFTFIHAVEPRAESQVKQGQVEGALRPIASVFVCVEDMNVILNDGYYEMPHACGRLLGSNGEVWGRGPGLDVMTEIKLVNRMKYDFLLALEKEVRPGWLMPADSAYKPDNRPDGITYWDASNAANKPEQLLRQNRLDLAGLEIEAERERIRRAFFVDMFQMLNRPEVLKGDKTAFQIAEMLQEKLLLFAPFFARITMEILSPLLERAFLMRIREGRCAQPPAEMGNALEYKITFTSKIALAIKAAQDNATVDMLNLCSLMAPFDQSVPMVIKWRDRYRAAARNRGIPAGDLRTDEEIDAMLQQVQEAEAAMKQAEQAVKLTKSAQNLGPQAQEAATSALTGRAA